MSALCPMPLRVERMALSWLCIDDGRDITTGFRIWGDRAREPVFRVAKAEHRPVYHVQGLEFGHWVTFVTFGLAEGSDLNESRAAAIACAEQHEAERFNAMQFDPRSAQALGQEGGAK